jgi:hypothetical protein
MVRRMSRGLTQLPTMHRHWLPNNGRCTPNTPRVRPPNLSHLDIVPRSAHLTFRMSYISLTLPSTQRVIWGWDRYRRERSLAIDGTHRTRILAYVWGEDMAIGSGTHWRLVVSALPTLIIGCHEGATSFDFGTVVFLPGRSIGTAI